MKTEANTLSRPLTGNALNGAVNRLARMFNSGRKIHPFRQVTVTYSDGANFYSDSCRRLSRLPTVSTRITAERLASKLKESL
jgi:hypothetical protein